MLAALLKRFTPRLVLLGLLASATLPGQAADNDPPARAGRVSEVIGDAWLFDAESKDWLRVTRNQTVAEGDRLRTDERARVSLSVGSTSLWLDERSDLEFSQLDEGRVLLLLAKGDLGLRLRSQDAVSEYKVQTREGRFFAEQQGLYRVEQLDRGSRAFAIKGRFRFEFERGQTSQPVWLQDGEQAEFWWAGGPRTEIGRIGTDGFGEWLLAQSRAEGDRFASGVSQRYVSPEMTGADELDRHGSWTMAPEYGNVWIPSGVAVDWAPYRYGRWAWSRHWGWTWVDDSPWGYAPFHYGRWVHWGGRWAWAPGRYVARPVYAPALVGWVGGVQVSVGGSYHYGQRPHQPHYGWYPLGPREVYVPPYRHSPVHKHRITFDPDPVTVKRPHTSNRDVGGAVSYLPGQGAPVRAMPSAEIGPVRPLPTAPARHELAAVLPARAVVDAQVKPAPADMPWRSDTLGRREPERDQVSRQEQGQRDFARERARALLRDPNGPLAAVPAQLPTPAPANTRVIGLPESRSDAPAAAQRPEPLPRNDAAQASAQARQAADRGVEQLRERYGPNRGLGFEPPAAARPQERQIERQVERQRPIEQAPPQAQIPQGQMQSAPRPQPEALRPPQPQRQDDAGPRRNRAEDGQRANGERRRGEAER